MCHSDDLETLIAQAVDQEEWKAAQQDAPGVAEVGMSSFRPPGNQVDGTIELVPKACRRRFIALTVPPLGGLRLVGGERVNSTASAGISERRVADELRPRESS